MRFEIILLPDALNSHSAEPLGFGHGASAPVSLIWRRRMKRCLDNSLNFCLRNLRNPSWTRSILFQPPQPQCKETITPELHRRSGNIQSVGDRLVQSSVSSHLNNSSALYQSRRQTAPSTPGFQCHSFFGRQHNLICSVHESDYNTIRLNM